MKLPSSDTKIIHRDCIKSLVRKWRDQRLTIAFTNGVFDILHRGHLYSLEQAAAFCDKLIVGVNSDASALSLGKGPDRPINNEQDRASLLAGLASVDAVVIFDESTPWELLRDIKPDILAKGGDYKLEEIVGREFAGRVERLDLKQGLSTTKLIGKIRSHG